MQARIRRTRIAIPLITLLLQAAPAWRSTVFAQPDTSPMLHPGLNIDPRAGAYFASRVEACLTEIAKAGNVGAQLVNEVRNAPAFIVVKWADYDGRNQTAPSRSEANGPVTGSVTSWSPDDVVSYRDLAPRVPCATLLHELQHALDIAHGLIGGPHSEAGGEVTEAEIRAVRTENWLLWRRKLRQRRNYGPTPLGPRVLWGSETTEIPAGPPAPRRPRPPEFPGMGAPVPGAPTGQPPVATQVQLTVVNDTPELILITGPRGQLLCGGNNPYFRAEGRPRQCSMTVNFDPSRNPFEVPIVSLAAYFPSGDPNFPRNGRVVWSDDGGGPLGCGGNAYSEYCAIALGERGSTTVPLRYGSPASRTVHVRYEGGTQSEGTVKGRILPRTTDQPR